MTKLIRFEDILVTKYSNFYLAFGENFSGLDCYFQIFEVKNNHEIIVIQTHPFTDKQTGIQTLHTQKIRQLIYLEMHFP